MFITWQDCLNAPEVIDKKEIVGLLASEFEIVNPSFSLDKESIDRPKIQSLLNAILLNHFGSWVTCWSDSAGDGGFVKSWCCSNHSVFPSKDKSIATTFERVADAVMEWHEHIGRISILFSELDNELAGVLLQTRAERSAVKIAQFIIKLNDASDAWYGLFQQVYIWYLETHEDRANLPAGLIYEICEGHFQSWVHPTKETIEAAAQEFGKAIVYLDERESIDTTEQWCQIRNGVRTNGIVQVDETTMPECDVHLSFVTRIDAARSESRGAAMHKALQTARSDAGNGIKLDWKLLCQWQKIVLELNEVPQFRTSDAYAKQGRERYPLNPGTRKQFLNRLDQVNNTETCPIEKAALIYFDICFFHPFDDGNARLARLALDYVLTAHDLTLKLAEPIFTFPLSPNDYVSFKNMLISVVGKA